MNTLPKFNMVHLKIAPWNRRFFWKPSCLGSMSNLGRVSVFFPDCTRVCLVSFSLRNTFSVPESGDFLGMARNLLARKKSSPTVGTRKKGWRGCLIPDSLRSKIMAPYGDLTSTSPITRLPNTGHIENLQF